VVLKPGVVSSSMSLANHSKELLLIFCRIHGVRSKSVMRLSGMRELVQDVQPYILIMRDTCWMKRRNP